MLNVPPGQSWTEDEEQRNEFIHHMLNRDGSKYFVQQTWLAQWNLYVELKAHEQQWQNTSMTQSEAMESVWNEVTQDKSFTLDRWQNLRLKMGTLDLATKCLPDLTERAQIN